MAKLDKHELGLNLDKCVFEAEEVEFLGLIVGQDQLCMDPTKVEGIAKWPQPRSPREMLQFLGFGNFY